MDDSMSALELSEQKIDGIKINKPFYDLLGEIEISASGLIWGPEFSGKSTLALGLANALAEFGRVEYVPAEEDFGFTLTKKINQLRAYHPNLNFKRYRGLEDLKEWSENVNPVVIFIDSITVLNANDREVIQFANWCRTNKVGFWMVSHANKDGSYKGSSSLGHEPDIKIEVLADEKLAQTKKNRYLGELRSIPVPFTAKDIQSVKSTSKTKSKKKKVSRKKSTSGKVKESGSFDDTMNEVEEMLASA